MGLGAMFVFLVVAVVILPMIVRYVSRVEAGFTDIQTGSYPMGPSTANGGVAGIPAIGNAYHRLPIERKAEA